MSITLSLSYTHTHTHFYYLQDDTVTMLPKTFSSNSTCSNYSLTCSHHITPSLCLSGDKSPVVLYRSLALSAPNGPSVWPPIRCPSLHSTLPLDPRPSLCVREDYSGLSAPKSTLLKSASQTAMVFKKRTVCTAACGELMSVYAMYAFSVTYTLALRNSSRSLLKSLS